MSDGFYPLRSNPRFDFDLMISGRSYPLHNVTVPLVPEPVRYWLNGQVFSQSLPMHSVNCVRAHLFREPSFGEDLGKQ